ncbi:calcium-activated potassium channel subunit beta-2 isoform X2 [Pelobates cultripes]|uniref:Calcium-activated potassium channel subunit beta-2 isoform X2 n=1 Tax=Pelobates cultripes TaxID=61616 RepID=A0AAD1RCF4_PELCU|nr:calcium-activated potassium channel subunit beta-2 isoform X2 [Pelobates cultripes]
MTTALLQNLGFVINVQKSILTPSPATPFGQDQHQKRHQENSSLMAYPSSRLSSHNWTALHLYTGLLCCVPLAVPLENFYQKIKDHDLLDKRKTVTALKAGEDRAILLGLAMMVCSIMMYFLLGITLLRSYMQSVWTEETQCTLINASITETFNCSFSCGPDCWKISQYPCLQVYVNLTSSGQKVLLYHTEETLKVNSECSYIPRCGKNYEESMSLVNIIMENFRKHQRFSCFYDPEGNQKNVILTKLYSSNVLFHSLFWPTCMMVGGIAIIAMVKLTQYLSLLCERIQRINR